MTRDEFLEALRQTRTSMTWGFSDAGELRGWITGHGTDTLFCPLTAVATKARGLWEGPEITMTAWWKAMELLDLTLAEARAIVSAADGTWDQDGTIREALVHACGLEESV